MITHPVPSYTPIPRTQFSARIARLEKANRVLVGMVVALGAVIVLVLVWTHQVLQRPMPGPFWVGMCGDQAPTLIDPDALKLKPTEAYLRGALYRFTKLHWERRPDSAVESYTESLDFMDRRLATGAAVAADVKEISALTNGQGDEVRINPTNVSLRRVKDNCEYGKVICEATVEYTAERYNLVNHALIRKQVFTAEVAFALAPVTTAMVKTNPFGLVILDLHTAEAFTQ
jgi:hypothetical protein